jgi:hypothetical protein
MYERIHVRLLACRRAFRLDFASLAPVAHHWGEATLDEDLRNRGGS